MADKFAEDMMRRTKEVATSVVALASMLKRGPARRVFMDQMVRSATSVGANYRAAQRARSKREFTSKLSIVLEEADETLYWLELAVATKHLDRNTALPVWKSTNEVVRILVRSLCTSRGHRQYHGTEDPPALA